MVVQLVGVMFYGNECNISKHRTEQMCQLVELMAKGLQDSVSGISCILWCSAYCANLRDFSIADV